LALKLVDQPAVAPRTRDCGWGRTRRRTASGGALAGKVELAGLEPASGQSVATPSTCLFTA